MIFFDGFLDSYFAYDFTHPVNNERTFTTQPQRHNEPNINLAYLGLNLKDESWRGRLAVQAGNSVEANTAYEVNSDLGHIQESYLGYKFGDTWIDAGIYLGHIGMESWVSKNNFTYTRSMQLDYVPYYATGIRASLEKDSKTHLEFHVMNGWQNISETNSAKSVGIQYKRKLADERTFTYNNFLGDEKVLPGQKDRFRTYHNFILETKINDSWKNQTSFDVGTQSQQNNDGVDSWLAIATTFQQKLSEKNFVAYRLEHYSDPHQSNVVSPSPEGFQVVSASINFDRHFSDDLLWRNEFRGYYSKDDVLDDSFVVTSFAVSF